MESKRNAKRARPDDPIDNTSTGQDSLTCKIPRLQSKRANASASSFEGNRYARDLGIDSRKDWRQVLCEALGVSSRISDDTLENEIQDIVDAAHERESNLPTEPLPDPFYKVLYRVHCACHHNHRMFCEKPFLLKNDDSRITSHLAGQNRITDLTRFIARNRGISFVVVRVYTCCNLEEDANPTALIPQDDLLILCSEELCEDLCTFRSTTRNGDKLFPEFKTEVEFALLNPSFYWCETELLQLVEADSEGSRKQLSCLLNYLNQEKRSEFDEATLLFEERQVTRRLLPYLFAPMATLVEETPRGIDHFRCVKIVSQPRITSRWGNEVQGDDRYTKRKHKRNSSIVTAVTFETLVWDFDGNFKPKTSTAVQEFHWHSEGPTAMQNLGIYPFLYANVEIQDMIRKRGEMFWKCRFRNYISYSGWDIGNQEYFHNSRFMVDVRTWQASARSIPSPQISHSTDHLGIEAMNNEQPPGNGFILLLPAYLNGFNMDEKRWKNLLVSRMRDVVWDEMAFRNLVLPEDTKDVIKALVTCRVSGPSSTDLIRGKGSGLILLFHGPPGTGKTLTAESVAECARKPLYRVTCGDIGTNPESVERFLGNVLGRAKLWDCVVLLDEAEVFLQERSLTDLPRNALVSVFLRVLEYHDGILILTSNRVGTLDEGFKSRIQLGIEYPKLDNSSRRRVWDIFIKSLQNDPAGLTELDIPDLRRNVDNLAKYELNGREIRNALNVARPLALSNNTKVDFRCLKKVIDVQQRFGQYIIDMNEGLDDEKVAREDGKR